MTGHERGFTLLELMVVIVVLGFVVLEIHQGFHFGLQASTMQSRLISRQADLDSVDRLLRGLIARMDPGSRITPPRVIGSQDVFAFTTELPAGVGGPVERHVDVSLSLEPGGRLVLRWVPHIHSGTPVTATPLGDVLLTGLGRLQFSYLYPEGAARHGWSDQWSEPFLPRLVSVCLSFANDDRQPWPDIVAEPLQDRTNE